MPSANKTPYLGLNNWGINDKPLYSDYASDNQKIDNELQSHNSQLADIVTINVKQYGAKGDGITDDSTAIRLAIAALPLTGGTLLFPPGIYLHGDGITTGLQYPHTGAQPSGPDNIGRDIRLMFNGYSNIKISGYGATILSNPGNGEVVNNSILWLYNCTNVLIEGFTLDGNIDNRHPILNDYSGVPGAQYAYRNNLTIKGGCRHIKIVDVLSQNSMMDGFYVDSSGSTSINIEMIRCRALYNYRQGLTVGLCEGLHVTGGEFSFTGTKYGTLPKSGIDLEGGGTGTIKNVVFDGIKLEGNVGTGLIFSLNCVEATIKNSYIINDSIGGEASATSFNNNIINCNFKNSMVYIDQAGILIDKCKFTYDKDFVMGDDCIYVNDENQTNVLGTRASAITNSSLRCDLTGRAGTKDIGRIRVYAQSAIFSNNTLYNVSNVDRLGLPCLWIASSKGLTCNNRFITDNASFCNTTSFTFVGTAFGNVFTGYTINTDYSSLVPQNIDGIQQYDYICKTFQIPAASNLTTCYDITGLPYGLVKITWVDAEGTSYAEEFINSSPYSGSASAKKRIIEFGTPNRLLLSSNLTGRKITIRVNSIGSAFGIKVEVWTVIGWHTLGQNIVRSASYQYDEGTMSGIYFKSNIVNGNRYTTANRPTTTDYALIDGDMIYDTTLDKPIWWNGTTWKDAAGTSV